MKSTISVKNFEKFQHYKDRTPPWIKLYNDLLDDYEFSDLPDASKFHLLAIWLLASRSGNEIPYDEKWISRRINASGKMDLELLVASGFLIENQPLQGVEQDASTELALARSREERRVEKNNARAIDIEFDKKFWPLYPHKVGKADAKKAYFAARNKIDEQTIIEGVSAYIKTKPAERSWCNPATFLRQERWTDEPDNANGSSSRSLQDRQFAEMQREMNR